MPPERPANRIRELQGVICTLLWEVENVYTDRAKPGDDQLAYRSEVGIFFRISSRSEINRAGRATAGRVAGNRKRIIQQKSRIQQEASIARIGDTVAKRKQKAGLIGDFLKVEIGSAEGKPKFISQPSSNSPRKVGGEIIRLHLRSNSRK